MVRFTPCADSLTADDINRPDKEDFLPVHAARGMPRARSAPRAMGAKGKPRWKGGTVPMPFSSDTANKDRLGRAI